MRVRSRRGLTLAEVIILIAVTALITTTLVGTITLCLRYYREGNYRTVLEGNARAVMDAVTTEFRQSQAFPTPFLVPPATPVANPSGTPNSPFPIVAPTPFIVAGSPTPTPEVYPYICFTELMPANPLINTSTGLPNVTDPTNPLNYQMVIYYNAADPNTGCIYAVKRAVYTASTSGTVPANYYPSYTPTTSG